MHLVMPVVPVDMESVRPLDSDWYQVVQDLMAYAYFGGGGGGGSADNSAGGAGGYGGAGGPHPSSGGTSGQLEY